jgi:hypoxanthine phosphoribosyltransferase
MKHKTNAFRISDSKGHFQQLPLQTITKKVITVRDKDFSVYFTAEEIKTKIEALAKDLELDYKDKTPLFLGVLNGCIMFTSDLLKAYSKPCEVGFIKAASYEGMESTGKVTFSGMEHLSIENRDVIIVEDIVDTGNTLKALDEFLVNYKPKSLKICTLLFKREAYKQHLPIDYVCFEVENKFLLGYGLDYDGLGRNLPEVYILNE